MENNINKTHKMTMDNRSKIMLTGVVDVAEFDLKHVLLETTMGMLIIKGSSIKVKKVSLENGEIAVEGTIDNLEYSDIKNYAKKGKSIVQRMFR